MSTIPQKGVLSDEITPLDNYEFLASYIKAPNFVAGRHHKLIGGVALCQKPDNWDYGNSLEASVTCAYCQQYWSFRVNAEAHRKRMISGIAKNLFTKIHEMLSCHCTCCQETFIRLMHG